MPHIGQASHTDWAAALRYFSVRQHLCTRYKPIGIVGAMITQRDAQSTNGRGGRGARQRILNTAIQLFYHDGINATGFE